MARVRARRQPGRPPTPAARHLERSFFGYGRTGTLSQTTIASLAFAPIDVALVESFGISTGRVDVARNVVVTVRLRDSTVGWGEAAPFTAVNGETREHVLAALPDAAACLVGRDASRWRAALDAAAEALPAESPSARCAVETALLDALTRHWGISLWTLFGGAERSLESDITLVTGTLESTRDAAVRATRMGFRTLKIKIGGTSVRDDAERLRVVAAAAPDARWVLDANGAMTVDAVASLIEAIGECAGRISLLEQPTPAEDLDGLRAIRERTRIAVAADESARTAADVVRLADARAIDVVNLKITKSGVVETLRMAEAAKAHGLGLMIGGMVETTIAMTTSACLAGGLGGFAYVDLDTPLFMKDPPTKGGAAGQGPRIDLGSVRVGHGVRFAERADR